MSSHHVSLQGTTTVHALVTQGAVVGVLARMHVEVPLEIVTDAERLGTLRASEGARLLEKKNEHVTCNVDGVGNFLEAGTKIFSSNIYVLVNPKALGQKHLFVLVNFYITSCTLVNLLYKMMYIYVTLINK